MEKKSKNESKIWLQCVAAFTSSLSIITLGIHLGWTSPTLPKLMAEDSPIPITPEEGSWIAISTLIGALVGGVLAAVTVDRTGRKLAILITIPVYFITWVMIAFAGSVAMLIIARILAGIADGIVYTAVPMYISEISDMRVRGLLSSAVPVMEIGGMLIVNAIAPYVSIPVMAWISSVIAIIQLFTFVWMPESPYFYLMKQLPENARDSLKRLRRTTNVDDELNDLQQAVDRQQRGSGSFWELFRVKSNRKASIIVMSLRTMQEFTGAQAFAFYTQMIFSEASDISPTISAIIYTGLQVILSFISSLFVDKLGRRPLLMISSIGSGLTLLGEGLFFYFKTEVGVDVSGLSWLPLTIMVLFIFSYSIGFCTVPMILLGELFPTNVKAMAMASMDIYFCLIASIVTKVFQITADSFGMYMPFFIFAATTVAGLAFSIFCVPETKGKSLEAIQLELKGLPPAEDKS